MFLTEESLEYMLKEIGKGPWVIRPTNLIVSADVKHLIDTDPNVRLAARLAGANV